MINEGYGPASQLHDINWAALDLHLVHVITMASSVCRCILVCNYACIVS